MTAKNSEQESFRCEHPECHRTYDLAVYEGIVPPADSMRYIACEEHAPDAPPVEVID